MPCGPAAESVYKAALASNAIRLAERVDLIGWLSQAAGPGRC